VKRSTGLPTLVIMCAPCHAAGKERKLAEFDLGPDGPSQTHHTVGAWSGPDGDDKVHLRCPCGHGRQVPRQQILEALAAITGKSTIYL
jgi:hypothetical protein